MKPGQSVGVHAGLLALAGITATWAFTRDKTASVSSPTDITVWSGKAADFERILLDSKFRKVTMEAQKDRDGRWYLVTVEKPASSSPHADSADGGAPAKPPAPTTYVSTTEGSKLVDLVAPLKVRRIIGKVAPEREAEFGLDSASTTSTVTVTVGGTTHKLVVGASTPGSGDSYAKDEEKGEVYVINGDVVRDLEGADYKLSDHELHEWKEADVTGATLHIGDKARKVVRGGEPSHKFWADAQSADKNDETLGNWMQKLDHTRPTEYASTVPDSKQQVVRVEYVAGSRNLGWFELWKTPGENQKFDYWAKSERTRIFAKVPQSSGEQMEQDAASVVK